MDPTRQRSYDFDTGVMGPTVVNNIIMQPQQGFGQPQQYPAGSFIPPQPSPHYSGGRRGAPGGPVPVPPHFGQPGLGPGYPQAQPGQGYHGGGTRNEKQPFISPQV